MGGSSDEHTDGIATQRHWNFSKPNILNKQNNHFLAVGYFRPHAVRAQKNSLTFIQERKSTLFSQTLETEKIYQLPHYRDHHTLNITDSQRKDVYQAYYASISFIDEEIGKLLNQLELLSLKETTIVILSLIMDF